MSRATGIGLFVFFQSLYALTSSGNTFRIVTMLATHSRKTMEIADRLYGVTMEEPGVSKLISIQLH
jgi:hypothetical protein